MTSTDPARSARMALIKGKDTKPEMLVRRSLHAAGLRYLLHDKRLAGRPDMVFPSRRAVLFVHGCFWHRHAAPSCPLARLPKTRLEFWLPKLEANAVRDAKNEQALKENGWQVIVVWECFLLRNTERDTFLRNLADQVKAMSRVRQH